MISAIAPAEFPWFRYDGYTFSLGLTDGERAWLSGHSASSYDAETGRIVVAGEMAAQADVAYAKVATILAAAELSGGDVSHLVENVTVAGVDAHAMADTARTQLLAGHDAPRITVVVERLLRPGALIEVESNARRGGVDDEEITLETILPVDDAGTLVAPGDLPGQYAACLTRAAQRLEAAGLDLAHVVAVTECLATDGRAAHGGLAPMRRYGMTAPAIATVVVTRLQLPGALVALNVTAARAIPRALDAPAGIAAVRAGAIVHVAGLAPEIPGAPEPDVVGQAAAVYDGILAALRGIGLGPEHVLRTIEYVHQDSLPAYRGVAGVRAERLRAPWPASTGAVCTELPVPGALIAVDAMARVDA